MARKPKSCGQTRLPHTQSIRFLAQIFPYRQNLFWLQQSSSLVPPAAQTATQSLPWWWFCHGCQLRLRASAFCLSESGLAAHRVCWFLCFARGKTAVHLRLGFLAAGQTCTQTNQSAF